MAEITKGKAKKELKKYAICIRPKYEKADKIHMDDFLDAIWHENKTKYSSILDIEECRTIMRDTLNSRPIESIEFMSISELIDSDLPPIEFTVEEILSHGVCVLSASPKMYKSFLCMQLGLCVSLGKPFLGYRTHKSGVLYIDLENDKRITKQRLETQLQGEKPPQDFFIVNDIPTMENGFSYSLSNFLMEHTNVHLVMIDIFQRIKYAKKSNQNDYDTDYKSITELKELAERFDLCIIIVTHNRKMVDDTDFFMNIMGSQANMGATDQAIIIHKEKRSDENATISITGRTVRSNDIKAEFDKKECVWKSLGSAEEYEERKKKQEYDSNPVIRTIKSLLDHNNGIWQGRLNELISASKYTGGRPITNNSKSLGRQMKVLIPQLYNYDAIDTRTISKGTASKIYEFKLVNPFEDTV